MAALLSMTGMLPWRAPVNMQMQHSWDPGFIFPAVLSAILVSTHIHDWMG